MASHVSYSYNLEHWSRSVAYILHILIKQWGLIGFAFQVKNLRGDWAETYASLPPAFDERMKPQRFSSIE